MPRELCSLQFPQVTTIIAKIVRCEYGDRILRRNVCSCMVKFSIVLLVGKKDQKRIKGRTDPVGLQEGHALETLKCVKYFKWS